MTVSDENYVLLMKHKNEKALEYFIDRDGWIVKSLLCQSPSMLPEDRQECMNDVFLTIWQNVGKYDETRAAFTTWVAGVTRYCILNYLKKHKRLEYQPLDEIMEYASAPRQSNPSEAEAGRQEFCKLLQSLSPCDREIFLKLFWEEKTYGEISREMKLQKNVLYNHVSRGKERLKKQLEGRL